jgi:hypothetical protein
MNTMPEDEARTKWCPMARTIAVRDDNADGNFRRVLGWNDDGGATAGPFPCRCIASACMAWRWADDSMEYQQTKEVAAGEGAPKPDGDGWEEYSRNTMRSLVNWRRKRTPTRGYCGAFGRPDQ